MGGRCGDPVPRGCLASTEGVGQRPACAQPPSCGGTADRGTGGVRGVQVGFSVPSSLGPGAFSQVSACEGHTHACLLCTDPQAPAWPQGHAASGQLTAASCFPATVQGPQASAPLCTSFWRGRLLHSLCKKDGQVYCQRPDPHSQWGSAGNSQASLSLVWPGPCFPAALLPSVLLSGSCCSCPAPTTACPSGAQVGTAAMSRLAAVSLSRALCVSLNLRPASCPFTIDAMAAALHGERGAPCAVTRGLGTTAPSTGPAPCPPDRPSARRGV